MVALESRNVESGQWPQVMNEQLWVFPCRWNKEDNNQFMGRSFQLEPKNDLQPFNRFAPSTTNRCTQNCSISVARGLAWKPCANQWLTNSSLCPLTPRGSGAQSGRRKGMWPRPPCPNLSEAAVPCIPTASRFWGGYVYCCNWNLSWHTARRNCATVKSFLEKEIGVGNPAATKSAFPRLQGWFRNYFTSSDPHHEISKPPY